MMLNFWREYHTLDAKLNDVQRLIQKRLTIRAPEIAEALQLFAGQGGKMIRPALFLLFAGMGPSGTFDNSSNKSFDDEILKIAASLELLHLATLIHDDIIDDSETRRKAPTIQAKLGKDTAVYAGDFVYTLYFELLTESMTATPFLSRNALSMKKILNGELTQKALLFKQNQTVSDYFHAIKGKTAELIALSCEEGAYFGQLSKEEQRRARRIGRNIGLAFQIYDDCLNFSLKFKNEKPILTDILQGIYTLPLLYAKEAAPAELSVYLETPELLSQEERIHLAELVETSGGLKKALTLAKRLSDKAVADINKLPDSENRQILLLASQKLLQREY